MPLPKIALQGAGKVRISDLLSEVVTARGYNTMGVAVAFASVAGVTELLDSILSGRLPSRSYWLFGLDNFITHPDAIRRAMELDRAQVRVAGGAKSGGIFHPKLYWFSDGATASSLLLGSANLTIGGLSSNAEAVAALESVRKEQSAALNAVWDAAWKLGKKVTPKMLEEYQSKFDVARKARQKAGLLAKKAPALGKNKPVLSSDDARIAPALATKCWIEVGNITGFRQDQLEIKAEQALFFGWPAIGGEDQILRVRLVSGAIVEIAAHYFGNHMWRLWLPQSIPEVSNGLRVRRGGKLLRSNYVAVFIRKGKGFGLRFVKLNSTEFRALRKATEDAGTLGRTTAREYGWV